MGQEASWSSSLLLRLEATASSAEESVVKTTLKTTRKRRLILLFFVTPCARPLIGVDMVVTTHENIKNVALYFVCRFLVTFVTKQGSGGRDLLPPLARHCTRMDCFRVAAAKTRLTMTMPPNLQQHKSKTQNCTTKTK